MGQIGFVTWKDVGWWSCQDHEARVPIGNRMMMVGGRVAKRPDPDTDKSSAIPEWAVERGMSVVGDIHPFGFWQTVNRGVRPMGSMSMAWSGIVVDGATGGFGTGRTTGHKVKPSVVLPQFGSSSKGITLDGRYERKIPAWTPCFSALPQGTQVMLMPGTVESGQADIMMPADGRLFAVHIDKAAEIGTLVCDIQPEGEICMDGSDTPGVGGRHARLQSMMRVIPMPDEIKGLDIGKGNGIAWNGGANGVDKMMGFGMMWLKADDPGSPGADPVKPGPITQSFGSGSGGGEVGGDGGSKGATCEFGKFKKKLKQGYGTALMARGEAFGPLSLGSGGCKHHLADDADGNPIVPGHLSHNAFFWYDDVRDGPLLFESGEWPDPKARDMTAIVHMVWDTSQEHEWVRGTLPGKWRWWSETTVYTPPPNPSPGVRNPAPLNGSQSFGGSSRRPDISTHVGHPGSHHRMFEHFHPQAEGFAHISFRPQLWVKGATSFVHNTGGMTGVIKFDEWHRPQVMKLQTWGGQNDSGEWVYQQQPDNSVARGGIAHGGVLLTPPHLTMEDYFGINSTIDVRASVNTSYFMATPGTAFALGTPKTNGGLNAKSVIIGQIAADNTNDPFTIFQLNSSDVAVPMLNAELDQSTSEVVVRALGSQAFMMPRGTTAQRPAAATPLGGIRMNTEIDIGGEDAPEYYESSTGTWKRLTDDSSAVATAPIEQQFTASENFSFNHNLGTKPSVSVVDSDGFEIVVCEHHPTDDTVVLYFNGTITNGVLILKP